MAKRSSPCLVVAVALSFLVACATTGDSHIVSSERSHLSVACEPRADLATEDFRAISCNIKNNQDGPVTVQTRAVNFNPDNEAVRVATPEAIKAYQQSFAGRDRGEEKSMIIGSLIVLGAAIGASAKGGGTGATAPVLVGAVGLGGKPASRAGDYTAGHLLGPAFEIKGGEKVTKLLIASAARTTPRPESMQICFLKPVVECLDVGFGPAAHARIGSW